MRMRRSTNNSSQKNEPRQEQFIIYTTLQMKFKFVTAIALTAMAMISCSEDTGGIGASLTDESDKLEVTTGFFNATSRSVLADSVFSRDFDCFLGMVKDPETGAYVKSEFMAQFNMLEDFKLPEKSSILSILDDEVIADSCELWLYLDRSDCYGDSLTPVKINVLELKEPMSDTKTYYSSFDPKREGFIREDGLRKSMSFSLANLTYSDSIRNLSSYGDIARISINDPYTDKNGKKYNNYGTYIFRNYYEHPEYFKNSYSFIHSLCPGFYFEVSDGLGVMANISEIDMKIYYRFKKDTTTYYADMTSCSTEEVLQTIHVINDRQALQRLVDDDRYTYLKTPAGIYTEVTLPVDDITLSHPTDSLLSVSMAFQRSNNVTTSNYPLSVPSSILMIQKDSLYSFFEHETIFDYKTSFMATLSQNAYSFNNIGNMITLMAHLKAEGLKSDPNWVTNHPNWNKVLLVPISTLSTYNSSGIQSISAVANEMGLSSTKLVGGKDHPIEIKVIYARFRKE